MLYYHALDRLLVLNKPLPLCSIRCEDGNLPHFRCMKIAIEKCRLCPKMLQVGTTAIILATRERMRLNGTVSTCDDGCLSIAVQQTFGSCPKYIQGEECVTASSEDACYMEMASCSAALRLQGCSNVKHRPGVALAGNAHSTLSKSEL